MVEGVVGEDRVTQQSHQQVGCGQVDQQPVERGPELKGSYFLFFLDSFCCLRPIHKKVNVSVFWLFIISWKEETSSSLKFIGWYWQFHTFRHSSATRLFIITFQPFVVIFCEEHNKPLIQLSTLSSLRFSFVLTSELEGIKWKSHCHYITSGQIII